MKLHETLPFTSLLLVQFSVLAVVLMYLGKLIFKKGASYKMLLTAICAAYLSFLYPKPLNLLGLILFLYVALVLLKKYYKSDNVIFPMLILASPIFWMKTANIVTLPENWEVGNTVMAFIQIAGLSYLVFKVIGMYVDERKNPTTPSFLDFFNFTSFFPTLLIGPIDRFKRFDADVQAGYQNLNGEFFLKGWKNLIVGLLYKFIIAEFIRRVILSHLTDDGSLLYHLGYMYTYLMYLFFDFAGYSLLAIALGNFLGINVPINFDRPFLALNPKEFWKKWHKSLGDWLNDYFFKPIFMYLTTRQIFQSIQRQNLALFATFTLMGFWNGFELHYILSGMLFGLYAVIHNYYVYRCKKSKRDILFDGMKPWVIRTISLFLMFNSVAFAIYLFSGKLI